MSRNSSIAINTVGILPDHTGCRTYITNLLDGMLGKKNNKYYLLTSKSNRKMMKKFTKRKNVEEIMLPIDVGNPTTRVACIEGIIPFVLSAYNPDVFFAPRNQIPIAYFGRSVVTVHSKHLNYEYYPKRYSSIQHAYMKVGMGTTLKKANKVIAITKFVKDSLISSFSVEEDKVEVVYEGVDKSRFEKEIDETILNDLRRKYSIENKNYFLCLSNLSPNKNIDKSIKAFSRFKKMYDENEHRLFIVGKDEAGIKNDLRNISKEKGVLESVEFLGRVPGKFVPPLYRFATSFLFPSELEGFGLPVLEAMASGTPVIGSCHASVPEIIADAGLVVDPSNIKEFAQALKKMSSSRVKRNEYIERGKKRADSFSWDKTASKTEKIISEA